MTQTLTFDIPDMECGACVRSITAAVHRLDGAAKISADLTARRVTITRVTIAGGTIATENEADFAAAIAAAGFSPSRAG